MISPDVTQEQKYRGFTAVELLLVSLIIAVLVGLVLPAFTAARKQTRMATCRSHLRQLGVHFEQYLADYDAYPNPHQLLETVRDKRILRCPEDDGNTAAASSYTFRSKLPPDFKLYWESRTLDPNTVLVVCKHHLEQKETIHGVDRRVGPPRYPSNLVLRAGGAVQVVKEGEIQQFFVPGDRPTYIRVYPGEPAHRQAQR